MSTSGSHFFQRIWNWLSGRKPATGLGIVPSTSNVALQATSIVAAQPVAQAVVAPEGSATASVIEAVAEGRGDARRFMLAPRLRSAAKLNRPKRAERDDESSTRRSAPGRKSTAKIKPAALRRAAAPTMVARMRSQALAAKSAPARRTGEVIVLAAVRARPQFKKAA